MKMLWKCTWENAVSFVLARSKGEAMLILDELGEVDESMLEPVDHRKHFLVTFQACYDMKHRGEYEEGPHWHATDDVSEDVLMVLGEPPPAPPAEEDKTPADPPPVAQIERVEVVEVGPKSPTSE